MDEQPFLSFSFQFVLDCRTFEVFANIPLFYFACGGNGGCNIYRFRIISISLFAISNSPTAGGYADIPHILLSATIGGTFETYADIPLLYFAFGGNGGSNMFLFDAIVSRSLHR